MSCTVFRFSLYQCSSFSYKYNEASQKYTEIAKGNPQWPQAFYPMKELQTVDPGEFLTARCTYDSTGRDRDTQIGGTAGDEMCNLYIMYYFNKGKSFFNVCGWEEDPGITENLPEDSDTPLPFNAELEEHAKHRHKGDLEMDQDHSESEGKGRKKGDLDNPGQDVDLSGQKSLSIEMPGAEPAVDDEYFCTAFNISKLTSGKKFYVTEFIAKATAVKAHHLILQKCERPVKPEGQIW